MHVVFDNANMVAVDCPIRLPLNSQLAGLRFFVSNEDPIQVEFFDGIPLTLPQIHPSQNLPPRVRPGSNLSPHAIFFLGMMLGHDL